MGKPLPPGEMSAAEIGAEGAEGPIGQPEAKSPGIMGILLHTQPPLSVRDTADKLDVSEPVAHYIVAARKALDAVTDTESGTGTSVLEHVIVGTVGVVTDLSDDDEPEAQPIELEEVGDGS